MTERIEGVELDKDTGVNALFFDGPAEFLAKTVCEELLKVDQWKAIFGENIDPYKRMDYAIRNLPALRVYNEQAVKEFDSWFIEGDLSVDVIFPGNLRRRETQEFQDTLSSALLQQFRRTAYFNAVTAGVPGLNELGKRFDMDKTLGFEFSESEVVPLTQIKINFRIDLRVWDEYLVSQDRTKEDPFEKTLGDLRRILAEIEGLSDNGEKEISVPIDQRI